MKFFKYFTAICIAFIIGFMACGLMDNTDYKVATVVESGDGLTTIEYDGELYTMFGETESEEVIAVINGKGEPFDIMEE